MSNHPAPHHPVKHHEVHHAVHHEVHHAAHPVHHHEPKSHEAELYAGIADPAGIRRPILEAARAAISASRIQDKLQQTQEEKLALRSQLVAVVKDIHHEVTRLQMVLPYRDVKESTVVSPPPTPRAAKPIEHKVDKIAAALAEIEARMNSL